MTQLTVKYHVGNTVYLSKIKRLHLSLIFFGILIRKKQQPNSDRTTKEQRLSFSRYLNARVAREGASKSAAQMPNVI